MTNKKQQPHRLLLCDPGEARTLDPMIKSHLLYQLSYGVIGLLISVAKVRTFSDIPNFLAKKFKKSAIVMIYGIEVRKYRYICSIENHLITLV